MELLIKWPYSLYDEGYCAVIVSHKHMPDGDLATLLQEAVYAVARHSDSGLKPLLDARGRTPQPPYPAVSDMHGGLFTLDQFALYKDGKELPRTGPMIRADDLSLRDRDWLTLDYVVRDRHNNRKPLSGDEPPQNLTRKDDLRAVIRAEIERYMSEVTDVRRQRPLGFGIGEAGL